MAGLTRDLSDAADSNERHAAATTALSPSRSLKPFLGGRQPASSVPSMRCRVRLRLDHDACFANCL